MQAAQQSAGMSHSHSASPFHQVLPVASASVHTESLGFNHMEASGTEQELAAQGRGELETLPE